MKNTIIESTQLDSESLSQLFTDNALALIVRGYADKDICKKMGSKINESPDLEKYYYELSENGERKSLFLGVSRLGTSFSTTFGKDRESDVVDKYYNSALVNINRIRDLFSPFLSPIDRLRLELDELYNNGAMLGTIEKRKMFTGIARITHRDMDLQEKNPHVDSLPPEFILERQYSANIYLSVPQTGGDLIVYPLDPMSQAEVDDFEANQKLWLSNFPDGIRIKPESGDLIIINTRRPHSVSAFYDGERVSLQTFIGINQDDALKLWC